MTRFAFFTYLVFAFMLISLMAPLAMAAGDPVDITADTALEWDRKNAQYIARGNASATQAGTTVKADKLIARYDNSGGGGSTDLTEIEAVGHVRILNGDVTLYGDNGIYNMIDGTARLTGEDLRMENADSVITADDAFVYDTTAQTVTATGNAVATRGDDRLESEKFIGYMVQDENGQTALDRIEVPQNVTIITPQERVTGNTGTYNPTKEVATLRGDVKIRQGENELNGARAEVNLQTGISRLFGLENDGGLPGRVRGVFYPKSDDSGE